MAKQKQKKFKGPVVSTPVLRKEFSYTKNNINLKFTLRTDMPDELVVFKELMETAIVDVQASIDAINEKK